jgi:hypothetical protein
MSSVLPHSQHPAYALAIDFAVLSDELSDQVPNDERRRAGPLIQAGRVVAQTVAVEASRSDGDWSQTYEAIAYAGVELDILERRTFGLPGIDDARQLLVRVRQALH